MTSSLPILLLLSAQLVVAPEPPEAPVPPAPPARVAPNVDGAGKASASAAESPRLTGEWPAKRSGRKVTLDGSMTVDQALGKIAAAAGWNLVATSGPDGARPVTLRFRAVPVEEALDAVLQGTSLVAARRGSIVTIAPGAAGSTPGSVAAVAGGAPSSDEAKSPRELRRELRKKLREEKREARAHRAGGSDRVTHGDQVVKAGEAADDVVGVIGNVRLEPNASAKDVVAVLGSVEVGAGATVEGDAVAVGGDVHLLSGAHVVGDAVSVGGKVIADEGAIIDGERTSVDVPGLAQVLSVVGVRSWSPQASRALSIAGLLARFAVFFALGLLVLAIAPRRMEALAAGLTSSPVKTVITGVLATIALPIAAILLAVTVIGIPLVPVLILAVLVAVLMGYTALALFVGRALPLPFERARTVVQLAIGTAVVLLLGEVPVLGWMVWVTGWLFVVGVVWRTRLGRPPVTPMAPPPVYGTTAPPVPPPMPPPAGGTGA